MKKLYILCGYPFAGKSTLAQALEKKFGFKRIAMEKFYKDNNKEIDLEKTYKIYQLQIEKSLKENQSVIVDTVAYNKQGRIDLQQLTKKYNAKTTVVYLDTPLQVVKKRWLQNKQTSKRHNVSEEEFDSIVNNFEIPTQEENVIVITPEMQNEDVYKLFQIET